MKTFPLLQHGINASQLVLGCMRMGGDWDKNNPYTAEHIKEGQAAVEAALDIGINMFDHADIYTAGKAERVFGEVLKAKPQLRERIVLQSKCGIKFPKGMFSHQTSYLQMSKFTFETAPTFNLDLRNTNLHTSCTSWDVAL